MSHQSSTRTAILQMADQGPVESTALMLRAAGYRVALPNKALRDLLRSIGCDTVLSPRDLTAGMGYDPVVMEEIGPEGMATCDLYGDVKAHKSYGRLVERWPRLAGRILWTRINGGEITPERAESAEYDPPCPVLTPNLWYAEPGPWRERSYACWPPFYRHDEYFPKWGRDSYHAPPVCLIHNVAGWGYRDLLEPMRALGVRVYGRGSPDGLVQHGEVPRILSRALCMVHLKSSDAPGYALYEALAAACPVVCTRRLIWRSRMESLLIPGKTCLVFDRETHEGLTPGDVAECTDEVRQHLDLLRCPEVNRHMGMAGRERLLEVMWREGRDGPGFREFMGRCFG